ncbi:MAG: zinc ribbon domain-containing protein, partial [Clostridia bacterium]|nr:zinc ribbon domain-containing protein [Clostridia bacterium]
FGYGLFTVIMIFTARKLCRLWDERASKVKEAEETLSGSAGELSEEPVPIVNEWIAEHMAIQETSEEIPEEAPEIEPGPVEETTEVEPEPVEQDDAEDEPIPDRPLFCRRCGAKLYEDSLFCNKCGTQIKE